MDKLSLTPVDDDRSMVTNLTFRTFYRIDQNRKRTGLTG